MKKIKLLKKSTALLALLALVWSSFGISGASVANAATTWDVTGDYVIDMSLNGDMTIYPHDWHLVQAGDDSLSGTGGSPAGANTYQYTLNPGGSVVGNTISFTANYTATADAVTPQTVMTVTGTIAEDGSMSGTWSDNYNGGARNGTWETSSGAAVSEAVVTTNAATAITSSNATLNGMNGDSAGIGHSFWASTSPFSTASPTLPAGVYSTPDMGPITADTAFSASLSSVSGLPAITADTTYYFAAWVNVGGTWYPGEVLSFSTSPEDADPATVKVTIVKYVDSVAATGANANNTDFLMNASWDAENIGAGSGQYSLSETGSNNPNPYQATTTDMTSGADYSTSEVSDSDIVALSCDGDEPYALNGYSTGDTLAAAAAATPTMTAPSFTNLTSDKFVIVWNDDCNTAGGGIGGDVEGDGVLAVTSIESIDTSAVADGTYENGWEYVFNITVPTDEPDLAMKFADWARTGGGGTIPAANNFRISSPQANNGGATVQITAANTYSSPVLHMTGDLNPSMDGLQVKVTVEARVPSGTASGSYTTSYGVLTN